MGAEVPAYETGQANRAAMAVRPKRRAESRMPDFLAVGPPRTGTTWLHYILAGHVGLPDGIKETQFFRTRYRLGIEWYAAHFARCRRELPVGEICPAYFAPEQVRERIKHHLPECRIICTLREPAERMYSQYKQLNSVAMIKGDFADLAFRHPDLVDFSRYGYHVAGWQGLFGRENVLVLIHEDSYSNRQGYVDQICDFIGIGRIDLSRIRRAEESIHSMVSAPRSRKLARRVFRLHLRLGEGRYYYLIKVLRPVFNFCWRGGERYPPLDSQLKQRIRRHLRPEIDALEELIGRDLSRWK